MPNISDGVRFVSWQGHGAAVLCVPHVQSAGAGDIQHGPAVTVRFPSANSTRNTVAPSPASSPPRPTSQRSRGLLALMLLHHARRASRTGPAGRLVPLAEQNRPRWDTGLIAEGVAILQTALARDRLGEYQAQAAIAAPARRCPEHLRDGLGTDRGVVRQTATPHRQPGSAAEPRSGSRRGRRTPSRTGRAGRTGPRAAPPPRYRKKIA
jgi:hypothetical protein